MERITLDIGGMSCGHCVGQVKKALERLPVGSTQVQVGRAVVEFDPAATTEEQIAGAVQNAGYDIRDVQRQA